MTMHKDDSVFLLHSQRYEQRNCLSLIFHSKKSQSKLSLKKNNIYIYYILYFEQINQILTKGKNAFNVQFFCLLFYSILFVYSMYIHPSRVPSSSPQNKIHKYIERSVSQK